MASVDKNSKARKRGVGLGANIGRRARRKVNDPPPPPPEALQKWALSDDRNVSTNLEAGLDSLLLEGPLKSEQDELGHEETPVSVPDERARLASSSTKEMHHIANSDLDEGDSDVGKPSQVDIASVDVRSIVGLAGGRKVRRCTFYLPLKIAEWLRLDAKYGSRVTQSELLTTIFAAHLKAINSGENPPTASSDVRSSVEPLLRRIDLSKPTGKGLVKRKNGYRRKLSVNIQSLEVFNQLEMRAMLSSQKVHDITIPMLMYYYQINDSL